MLSAKFQLFCSVSNDIYVSFWIVPVWSLFVRSFSLFPEIFRPVSNVPYANPAEADLTFRTPSSFYLQLFSFTFRLFLIKIRFFAFAKYTLPSANLLRNPADWKRYFFFNFSQKSTPQRSTIQSRGRSDLFVLFGLRVSVKEACPMNRGWIAFGAVVWVHRMNSLVSDVYGNLIRR